jgi:hypothetical protein
MIPCLAAAGVLFTRLCTRPSIPRLEQTLASTVLLYADCSTLMVGRPVTVTMKKKKKETTAFADRPNSHMPSVVKRIR